MLINFNDKQSLINQYIAEMRDKEIQKDSLRFRTNMERLGALIGYEISKVLEYEAMDIPTPLGISKSMVLKDKVVLSTILRAGLPLNNGFLSVFDKAESGFVTAYRKYHGDNDFDIKIEYMSSPRLEDKVLILSDPMLATGSSMVMAYRALLKNGIPKHTHIVAAIASKEGVEYIKRNIKESEITIWTGAIDDELTVQSYIVPGLGDAGDLAFGEKE